MSEKRKKATLWATLIGLAIALAFSGALLVGCGERSPQELAEDAAESIEDGAEVVKEGVEDAAKATKDAAEDLVD